nr:MAG TPA: hypothetical protein [Caudoviricetes sp.]
MLLQSDIYSQLFNKYHYSWKQKKAANDLVTLCLVSALKFTGLQKRTKTHLTHYQQLPHNIVFYG